VVHKAGFMHRDIKPPNIYIRDDSSPVLLDFGAARQKSSELTALVTPGYAPFEQYHTQGKQGAWSDIYALGGVLYWMVTGNSPHEAAARIRADTMPPALQAADKSLFRPEFLAAIDWALAPDEDQRPQSVPEWREALLGAAPTPPRTQAAQPRTQLQKTPPQPTTIPATFDPTLLKRLEAELAQHLGPIAPAVVRNAAKKAATQEELVQMLAADISASIPRAAFQRQFSEISRPVSKPPAPAASGPAVPPTALAASRFPQEVLDRATARLAEYIGALSRVVVKRAAIKARDEAELYLLIADEIEDPARKKAFIRRAISASGKP